MTDTTNEPDPRARQLAEAAARLVRDGIADDQAAIDFVNSQDAGRRIAERLNRQRGQAPQSPKTEEKKP